MTPLRKTPAALAIGTMLTLFALNPAQAGLNLQNQTEIHIGDLDLNHDGHVARSEVAEYMFFYFDRDGNETLTKGEYHARQPVSVFPNENDAITVVDLDGDGKDDGVIYNQDSFLSKIMTAGYNPEDKGIRALDFLDVYFLRLDTDKSKAIELDEWQKSYESHAVVKPNQAPTSANNDMYRQ